MDTTLSVLRDGNMAGRAGIALRGLTILSFGSENMNFYMAVRYLEMSRSNGISI
jgi:L-fucose isomerase-like protein